MEEKDKEYLRNLYTLATVGLNIVVATFIGLGMGWFLDNRLFPRFFHWEPAPVFTLIFLVLGIIAGFRNIFKIVRDKGDAGDDKDAPKGDFTDKDDERD